MGAVMLLLLATAGANTEFLERRYQLLIALNIGFVLLLMGVVGYLLWRLRRRLKDQVFGSRLALRLLLIFSLMAILPGLLVYSVSVQFLGKSIDSWFDVKVDRALEGGLNLGRSMLDNLMDELREKTQTAALTLSKQTALPPTTLNHLVDYSRMQQATLFNQIGEVIAFSGTGGASLIARVPSEEVIRQARAQGAYGDI
jgi:nitrogen fixation/metabolism regulation signal transduction histidine kinase